MRVTPWIFLVLALIGSALILGFFALFGNMVATGGLYGNSEYSDATFENLAFGFLILSIGGLPVLFVILLAFAHRKTRPLPKWLVVISWLVIVGISIFVILDVLTSLLGPSSFGILTLPVLPFTIGLLGFMVSVKLQKGS